MKRFISLAVCIVFAVCCFDMGCLAYSAKSYILINADTGEVLCSCNENAKLPMASTTKIMTALLLCESFPDLESSITVPDGIAAEGTSMGLKPGDTVTPKALLYGMMLASGNDAANAAAIAVSGSIKDFVRLMNKKAQKLGLNDTNFATPSGLDGENHYTTARDMAFLAREALKCEELAKACRTESITVSYGTPGIGHTLKNHNRLLREYEDITGVKTGYTSAAGRCLVSSSEKDGMSLICVTLNDKNDWADHRNLLDFGYDLLKQRKRSFESYFVNTVTVCGDTVSLPVPKIDYYSVGDAGVKIKAEVPRMLYPPLKKGDAVGSVYYFYDQRCIKEMKLVLKYDIEEEKHTALSGIISIFRAGICSV